MQNMELGRRKVEGSGEISSTSSDLSSNDGGHKGRDSYLQEGRSSVGGGNDIAAAAGPAETVLSIVITQPEEAAAMKAGAVPKSVSVGVADDKDNKPVAMVPAKKGMVRSESYHEQCRQIIGFGGLIQSLEVLIWDEQSEKGCSHCAGTGDCPSTGPGVLPRVEHAEECPELPIQL